MTSDARLTAGVAYTLTCPVFVTAGATLVIEAGSTVDAVAHRAPPFATVDANADASISAEELQRYYGRRGVPQPALDTLLAALDTDTSGSVTASEWASVEAVATAEAAGEAAAGARS